jgi:hypothetical protein
VSDIDTALVDSLKVLDPDGRLEKPTLLSAVGTTSSSRWFHVPSHCFRRAANERKISFNQINKKTRAKYATAFRISPACAPRSTLSARPVTSGCKFKDEVSFTDLRQELRMSAYLTPRVYKQTPRFGSIDVLSVYFVIAQHSINWPALLSCRNKKFRHFSLNPSGHNLEP